MNYEKWQNWFQVISGIAVIIIAIIGIILVLSTIFGSKKADARDIYSGDMLVEVFVGNDAGGITAIDYYINNAKKSVSLNLPPIIMKKIGKVIGKAQRRGIEITRVHTMIKCIVIDNRYTIVMPEGSVLIIDSRSLADEYLKCLN